MNTVEKATNWCANMIWGLETIFAKTPQKPFCVAHRGAHSKTLRENTREAFLKAVDLAHNKGLEAIEFDVHFTKDHQAVVHHDEHLGRFYNRPDKMISNLNFDELRSYAPDILTLKEVIDLTAKSLKLFIEIKKTTPLSALEEESLFTVLKNRQPTYDYYLLTLKPEVFRSWSKERRSATVAVDWMDIENTIQLALELEMAGVCSHFLLMTPARIQRLHKSGLKVGTGFVLFKHTLTKEQSRQIDWIFTDHAEYLLS